EESELERESDVVGSLVQADLVLNAVPVRVDGLRRDAEHASNLRAGVALGDEAKHGLLPKAQALEPQSRRIDRWRDRPMERRREHAAGIWADVHVAHGARANRRHELL